MESLKLRVLNHLLDWYWYRYCEEDLYSDEADTVEAAATFVFMRRHTDPL